MQPPERFVQQSFVELGGFAISDGDFAAACQAIEAHLGSRARLAVFFANTHFIVTCQPLRAKLSQTASVLILNDGIGISLARRILFKSHFSENLNGTDLVPRLLRESVRPLRLYLLGSSKASVEGAAKVFEEIPHITIAGTCDGYSLWPREAELIEHINAAKPDILLVALGCPLQERWILDHFERLDVPVMFGVGALFDFVSGQQARAPRFMRDNRLEWLYRLWREPRRLGHRYTIEILAFIRLISIHRS